MADCFYDEEERNNSILISENIFSELVDLCMVMETLGVGYLLRNFDYVSPLFFDLLLDGFFVRDFEPWFRQKKRIAGDCENIGSI